MPPGRTQGQGSFVEPAIPTQYHTYRFSMSGVLNISTTAAGPVCTSPVPTVTPCPISYSDVPPGNPFYSYVHCLACGGIVGGYAGGTFHPYANLTRGQIAKIVAGAAAYSDPIPPTQQTFADVPPTKPFWLPIEQMAAHGLISGYTCGGPGELCDGQHRP